MNSNQAYSCDYRVNIYSSGAYYQTVIKKPNNFFIWFKKAYPIP